MPKNVELSLTEVQDMCEDAKTLMLDFDLPIGRRDCTRAHHTKWLVQNVAIRNSDHPKCQEVRKLLIQIARAQHVLTPAAAERALSMLCTKSLGELIAERVANG